MSDKELNSMDKELEVFDTNGEIDWDSVSKIFKTFNSKEDSTDNIDELKPYVCKKCNKTFHCANYNGKYPLCSEHRKRND